MVASAETPLQQPSGRLRQFARDQAPLCFTTVTLLVFFLSLWCMPLDASIGEQWTREIIRQYEWTSSSDQRAAHLLALAVIALSCGISFKLAQRGFIQVWHGTIVPRWGVYECVSGAVLGFLVYSFLLPIHSVLLACAISVAFLLFAISSPKLRAPAVGHALTAMIGLYFAGLVVPGLLVRPIPLLVDDPVALAQLEMHLDGTTMSSRAIAAGYGFDQLPYGYGMLMPSIMSVIDHITHSFNIGHQLRFVQICQLLFCFAAAVAYWCYRPRAHLGILAAMLLAGPYWVTGGLGIWHQNQTGFRSLGLPLGMLALALAGRMSLSTAAWWLGAVGAIALLINFETAVAVSVGYTAYLVARMRQFPFSLFLRVACAGLTTIVVWLIIYRLALGRLPFSGSAVDLSYFFDLLGRFTHGSFGYRLFSAGHENQNYFVVPFALLMFAHAIYVTIQSATRLGQGPLNHHASMRLAVAITLLFWFAYYINAPNWWQLWTHLFLYGFLVIDLLDRRRFAIGYPPMPDGRLMTRLRHMRIAPAHFAFLFLLAMMLVQTNRHLVKYTSEFMHPEWLKSRQSVVVSDVLVPRELGDALRTKAAALTRLYRAANGNLVYLTFNVAFIPDLTGIFQRDPYQDLWVRVAGEAAFEGIMRDLLGARPEIILIDTPTGPLAVSGARQDFQNRIREAVGHQYRNSGTEDGWEVWRPQHSPKAASGAANQDKQSLGGGG